MAYLTMMSIRLKELHRVLKPTGSIYLHCDPTASHYLKLLLDAVFGPQASRNEIVWKRTSSHSDSKKWAHVHAIVLYYSKGKSYIWNGSYKPHDPEYIKKFYRHHDSVGQYRLHEIIRTASMGPRPNLSYEYKGYTPEWGWRMVREKVEALDEAGAVVWSKSGRPYRKQYLHDKKGAPVTTIWDDIPPISGHAAENLPYPTQKPEALLVRIIEASSNKGNIVLDPFCGCGTAIAVAERLNRKWVGIDITHLAVTLMKHRLHDAFGNDLAPCEVIGDPKDLTSAKALAEEDRYQFEWWALGLVEAQPAQDKKKGADNGIDGLIYFIDNAAGKVKRVLVQVKSGHVQRAQVSDLCHALDREDAAIGLFVTLEKPTRPMIEEAATAGFYEPEEIVNKYPRMQILTIEELLDGKKAEYPREAGRMTYKKAKSRSKRKDRQEQLFDG